MFNRWLAVTMLTLSTLSLFAHTTGVVDDIFKCSGGGIAEGLAGVHVYTVTTTNPETTRTFASASEVWTGGIHYSHLVEVQVATSEDHASTSYSNNEARFKITVKHATVRNGKIVAAQIFGSFVDPQTKMTGHLNDAAYICK